MTTLSLCTCMFALDRLDCLSLYQFSSSKTPTLCAEPALLVPNSTTRTPATDATNGRAHNNSTTCCFFVVQQIHGQRTKICHIPTSCHVEMLGSGIAMWQICCRIIVVSLSDSVGGVGSRCPCSGVWVLPALA